MRTLGEHRVYLRRNRGILGKMAAEPSLTALAYCSVLPTRVQFSLTSFENGMYTESSVISFKSEFRKELLQFVVRMKKAAAP